MKEKIIINVIYFVVSYLIIFLLYSLVINRKKKSYKDATKQMDILYLVNKFKLNTKKTKYNTLKWITNIINPLIISITFIIVTNIKSFILGIISFVLMLFIGLIPCAVAGIGAYCAYVSKNRLNLAMNVIIFVTSIMVLFIS